ncbi:hypothetical protein ACFORK_22295 [Paenibacillus sp. GCM10012306]
MFTGHLWFIINGLIIQKNGIQEESEEKNLLISTVLLLFVIAGCSEKKTMQPCIPAVPARTAAMSPYSYPDINIAFDESSGEQPNNSWEITHFSTIINVYNP